MSVSVENNAQKRDGSDSGTEEQETVDLQFEPVVTLPEIEVITNEENEEELIKLRAKLFRFDITNSQGPEWKERGTGEVKLLRHKENHSVRVVMRRDKTLKICANHFITPWMELKPSAGSNRAWVWTVLADFADEIAKQECLAIRFANVEIASQWKKKFDEARTSVKENCILYKTTSSINDSDIPKNESNENAEEEDSEDKIKSSSDEDSEDKTKLSTEENEVINKIAELNVSK